MVEYGKLAWNKIPQIIREKGERPVTRNLSDGEFLSCLSISAWKKRMNIYRADNWKGWRIF